MKIKVVGLVLVMATVFFVSSTIPVEAAKKRVWKATTVSTTSGGSKFSVSAKLTGWKQYLNLSFKGVAATEGVTYELVYSGNGNEQGVYGTVTPKEGNVTRQLFLGTCSTSACTPYKNIGNLKLTITYKTKDGQTLTKRYKVKY